MSLRLSANELPEANPRSKQDPQGAAVLALKSAKDVLLLACEHIRSALGKLRQPAPRNWRSVQYLQGERVVYDRAQITEDIRTDAAESGRFRLLTSPST